MAQFIGLMFTSSDIPSAFLVQSSGAHFLALDDDSIIRRAADERIPTRNVSEGTNDNPSLTERVVVGKFLFAARFMIH